MSAESDILQKLRNVLQWHVNDNNSLNEHMFQILYHLYMQGIINESKLRLVVFPINKVELKCKVTFEGRRVAFLSGCSDLGVGVARTDKLTANERIVELKAFGGKMTRMASLNHARDQLLGQLYTMQSSCPNPPQRSQGLLTDLSRIMIAFGCKPENSDHRFVISSTIQEPVDYICHLLFVLMKREESKRDTIFNPKITQPLPVDDEDTDEAPGDATDSNRLTQIPTSLVMPKAAHQTKSRTRKVGGRQRQMRVIDLNADDREYVRERELRYIYAHDMLCQGEVYLSKDNIENRQPRNPTPYAVAIM